MSIDLRCGDALALMREMPEAGVDAVVTDPPYGLRFMGKAWDHGIPGAPYWTEALRVAKPGAHLLAFGGTRTFHRLTCAIEDAGWKIRDCVMWVYGSGFPKSHNLHGEREGWGTALKPAWEPIIVARKPLVGTVAANVLAHGTGAMNVDGCRVKWAGPEDAAAAAAAVGYSESRARDSLAPSHSIGKESRNGTNTYDPEAIIGRWPANVVHDGSEEVVERFPAEAPSTMTGRLPADAVVQNPGRCEPGMFGVGGGIGNVYSDSGSAARFFYCAKASHSERNAGLDCDVEYERSGPRGHTLNGDGSPRPRPNHHPTVKPVALMQWLCRLVTPPAGIILDPFMGSGSTGVAADREGFSFIGFDLSPEYVEIARRRISADAPLFHEVSE
jgi:site-specific DNA-methyltransferase (adenine-specific)